MQVVTGVFVQGDEERIHSLPALKALLTNNHIEASIISLPAYTFWARAQLTHFVLSLFDDKG